ncbi:hypothetical protein [Fundidesulfovibrio putealis]|uniref:hypothetical protein n=1 Tax=Fundidesulfovibrio putealis TaxID=270496 RepID=UPI0003F7E2F2|nr:hypothetical protein [Fundidesulfovibrio putealis]
MIEKQTNVNMLGKEDFEISTKITSNNIPLLEENYIERMNSCNGFTKDRHFQKVASIPYVAILRAEQEGYDMNNEKDVLKFLAANPEFTTANYYVTPGSNSHKIIIK